MVYTDSIQTDFGLTQSLHRPMQIYTESTRRDFGVNTESTQSNADLHRVYTE